MSETTEKRSHGRRRKLSWWQEALLLVVLAVALSVLIKTFLVQMFYVPSGSMRPLFVKDDRILVEKVSHWTSDVERGEVVVFSDPGGWLEAAPGPTGVQWLLSRIGLYPSGGHLVKRVIGVGGDHVMCCDDRGRITVNGDPIGGAGYLREGLPAAQRPFEVVVPEGRLWVMGDNRSSSEDSRAHQEEPGGGTIPVDHVVGKVWAIVWPMDRASVLDDPDTFDSPGPAQSG